MSLLVNGLSFILCTQNNNLIIKKCIESLIPILYDISLTELIIVDLNSTDGTVDIIKKYTEKYCNIFSYCYENKNDKDIRVDSAVVANWALEKSTKFNIVSWNPNYIADPAILEEMIYCHNLKFRDDKFSLWFTGKSLYCSNTDYYIVENSDLIYNDFRVFSNKHNFKWKPSSSCSDPNSKATFHCDWFNSGINWDYAPKYGPYCIDDKDLVHTCEGREMWVSPLFYNVITPDSEDNIILNNNCIILDQKFDKIKYNVFKIIIKFNDLDFDLIKKTLCMCLEQKYYFFDVCMILDNCNKHKTNIIYDEIKDFLDNVCLKYNYKLIILAEPLELFESFCEIINNAANELCVQQDDIVIIMKENTHFKNNYSLNALNTNLSNLTKTVYKTHNQKFTEYFNTYVPKNTHYFDFIEKTNLDFIEKINVKKIDDVYTKYVTHSYAMYNKKQELVTTLTTLTTTAIQTTEFKKAKKDIDIINRKNTELRSVVIIYHKNITQIYPRRWITKNLNSVINQTYQNFDIIELNYGMDKNAFVDVTLLNGRQYTFLNINFDNHVYAMYYLLDSAFNIYNYDVVFNTNIDDYYHPERFEKQIQCIKRGAQLVSCYWRYIEDINGEDVLKFPDHCDHHSYCQYCIKNDGVVRCFDNEYLFYGSEPTKPNIYTSLLRNHNVLCHPGICYEKGFWKMYDNDKCLMRYQNYKPYEDLLLWKKFIQVPDSKIEIVPEPLVYYRIHQSQVSSTTTSEFPSENIRVGILIVCTGKYVEYFEQLVRSINKYFMNDCKKLFYIFTDNESFILDQFAKLNIDNNHNIITKIKHCGFPAATLYRYHYFIQQKYHLLLNTDFVFYLDVDMRIESEVKTNDIISTEKSFYVVKHPGFYTKKNNGTVETRSESTAYVDLSKGESYYVAGGFNGGRTSEWILMAEQIIKNVDIDDENEIIAVWHDESHLNKYVFENQSKFSYFEPEYCYPENWNLPFDKKIIALDKPHSKIRSPDSVIYISTDLIGGLGNKLFMVACGIALSYDFKNTHNKNSLFVLPITMTNFDKTNVSRTSSYRSSVFSSIYRTDTSKIVWDKKIKETGFSYQNLINTVSNIDNNSNILLDGYFQSYKYFDKYRDVICETIKLPPKLEIIAKQLFLSLSNLFEGETVSIHVRRTDYLTLSHFHYNLPNVYYQQAIQRISDVVSNPYFIIFSDDIDYCKTSEIFKNLKKIYYVPETYQNYISLYIMSYCEHNIIANSSFSWWGAYLNQNIDKKVIIPKKWFSEKGPVDFNINDVALKNWIQI